MSIRVRTAWLVLAVCSMVSSAPALLGSWVYDDWLLVHHPLVDGLEDLGPTFLMTSGDYVTGEHKVPSYDAGTTYRPLPMATFVLVNGTVGMHPLAHHLVSLACHLGVIFLLLSVLARERRVGGKAMALVTVFALHPALFEAYGWINARADILAGLALALVLATDRRLALVALLLLGGITKETFFFAAGAIFVARNVDPWRPRALAVELGLLVGTGLTVVVLRTLVGASLGASFSGAVLAREPQLLALSVQTIVAPWPRAMRLLAWELRGPLGVADAVGCLVPLLAVLVLFARRRYGPAFLVLGALGTLAPTALVADHYWLGFDRYLYMPAILLVAAFKPKDDGARAWWPVAAVLALGLGVITFAEARYYRSQATFTEAILDGRPGDPTGYLLAADNAIVAGDNAGAAKLLEEMPVSDLPAPAVHQAAAFLYKTGRPDLSAALLEHGAGEHPDDLNLTVDLFTVRVAQHRWDEATSLARRLADRKVGRKILADLIAFWKGKGSLPPEVVAAFEALAT